MKRISILIVALLGVVAAAGWFLYRQSPTYAIAQIKDAIQSRNRLKFQRYVDVDRLATSVVDGSVGQAITQAGSESNAFAAVGAAIGASMVQGMKPALVQQLKSSILAAIEDGRVDRVFARADSSDATLPLLSQRSSLDPASFIGTAPLEREGSVATLGLRLHDRLLDTVLVLRVRLDRGSTGWQLTGLDDFPAYLSQLDRLQTEYLGRVNQRLSTTMARRIRLGSLTRKAEDIGYSTWLTIRLAFTNIGSDTITSAGARLHNVRALDVTDSDAWLVFSGTLPPGRSGTMQNVHRFNEFIDWHSGLRYGRGIVPELFLVATRRAGRADTTVLHSNWAEYVKRLR